ncbi:MAG: GntR family transcriptional regulator [Gemmatimonadetes bacterium]|nr:GntR family transcriptional regulator [Gemmatimonadota bacterium]MBK7784705.1 GntR family transcriptional regulator [Gemmatimonadota bacterium]MBK9066383.1 GntR family transcriptional regulator [Gemmatimonadota bacterium]
MFEQIDPRSATPLYAQIATRLKVAIAAGDLVPGAGLPSVRQLAAQLRINPATVVQAYRELETEGFVEMRHGAGTFVREVEGARRARTRAGAATRLVRALLAEAARAGLTVEELRRALVDELPGSGA